MTKKNGKKPEDHKLPAGTAEAELEARLETDDVLANMPELIAPERLRIRDRSKIRHIMLNIGASGVFGGLAGDDDSDDAPTELIVDGDSIDPADIAKLDALDEFAAQIDEWAESIAIDKTAYAEWSGGKGYDEFFAILNRYSAALGE